MDDLFNDLPNDRPDQEEASKRRQSDSYVLLTIALAGHAVSAKLVPFLDTDEDERDPIYRTFHHYVEQINRENGSLRALLQEGYLPSLRKDFLDDFYETCQGFSREEVYTKFHELKVYINCLASEYFHPSLTVEQNLSNCLRYLWVVHQKHHHQHKVQKETPKQHGDDQSEVSALTTTSSTLVPMPEDWTPRAWHVFLYLSHPAGPQGVYTFQKWMSSNPFSLPRISLSLFKVTLVSLHVAGIFTFYTAWYAYQFIQRDANHDDGGHHDDHAGDDDHSTNSCLTDVHFTLLWQNWTMIVAYVLFLLSWFYRKKHIYYMEQKQEILGKENPAVQADHVAWKRWLQFHLLTTVISITLYDFASNILLAIIYKQVTFSA